MKPKNKKSSDSLKTAYGIANLLGKDRNTVLRKIRSAGIKPIQDGKRQLYDADVVRELFAQDAPEQTSTRKLLDEQRIRKLKIENDLRERLLIPSGELDAALTLSFTKITQLLNQRLVNEFPTQCHGLQIDEIRELGRRTFDDCLSIFRLGMDDFHKFEPENR